MNLRDLRTLQDWFVRYQLNSVPGVAEVASVGGYVQQYQVECRSKQTARIFAAVVRGRRSGAAFQQ